MEFLEWNSIEKLERGHTNTVSNSRNEEYGEWEVLRCLLFQSHLSAKTTKIKRGKDMAS